MREKISNYSKTRKQDAENTNCEHFFEGKANENRELFKRALSEAIDSKIRKIQKETEDIEIPPIGKRHKIRMNRLFRERIGGAFLPFPKEDNL